MIGAFSPPMAARVGPEVGLVIELDVRDRRHAEVEDVGRVEAAAHPDLDERQVDLAPRELGDGHGGERFELGRRPDLVPDTIHGGQDALDRRREVVAVDGDAVDCDPLAVAHEVRFRHGADAQSRRREHGPSHRDDRALAVRAANERAPQPTFGMADLGHEPLDPLEPHADPEAPSFAESGDGLAVGEPAGVGQAVSPRRPRRRRSR